MKLALKYFCFPVVIFALFSIFNVFEANAASLYFSPSSGNFSVGNILTTSVIVNTQGEAINNTDAVINFPAELLDVVSVNKSGSIFSLWVEEPAFSNSAGTITFNGGLPTPGFSGTAGKIINIVFRVKSAGSASLIFSSAAVRANDGFGTDVLKGRAQALFTLSAVKAPAEAPPAAPSVETPTTASTPSAPVVTSPDFVEQSIWYSKNSGVLNWTLPRGTTGVSYAFTNKADTNPGTRSDGKISSVSAKDLPEGVTYLSVRFGNSEGWGPTTHYALRVDTKVPAEPVITLVKDSSGAVIGLTAKASDGGSGIDHYLVKVDGTDFKEVKPSEIETIPFLLNGLGDGKHTITVVAYDKAKNTSQASLEVLFKLYPPEFTEYSSELKNGDVMVVRGKTYASSFVSIWVQYDNTDIQKYTLKSNGLGEFMFVNVERVKAGTYKLWSEVENEAGLRSAASRTLLIPVKQSAFSERLLTISYYLAIIIPLLALIIVIILLILHAVKKIFYIRKQLRKDIHDVEAILHKAFDLLREDVRAQIKLLERTKSKRELTLEEEKIIKRLRKDLDSAEQIVKDKIDHLEKEI